MTFNEWMRAYGGILIVRRALHFCVILMFQYVFFTMLISVFSVILFFVLCVVFTYACLYFNLYAAHMENCNFPEGINKIFLFNMKNNDIFRLTAGVELPTSQYTSKDKGGLGNMLNN